MAKQPYTPWHQVVKLRDDLRSGDLALSIFAADLYDVVMGKGRSVYRDPKEFFAFTYPTFNLREMAKDVLQRLAGKNDKAVRQLELTYGGGKTHSLITLFHLVSGPDNLPDLPAVREFRQHTGGLLPPKARVAVLAFDKLDVEKGMEVRGPDGKTRWLRHPWSALAFQIGGASGLRLLHADGNGRCTDNVFVERLWRSIKYEEVYLQAYQNGSEARRGNGAYLAFYNQERPHQALGYRTPGQVFQEKGPERCLQEHSAALSSVAGSRDIPAVDSLILASSLS